MAKTILIPENLALFASGFRIAIVTDRHNSVPEAKAVRCSPLQADRHA